MTPNIFPLPAGTPNVLPFKKALQLLVGGRYLADRMRLFRRFREFEYAKFERHRDQYPEQYRFRRILTPDEEIAYYQANGVPLGKLGDWNQNFDEWREKYSKQVRSEANRANVNSRWNPRKLKKTLASPAKRKK